MSDTATKELAKETATNGKGKDAIQEAQVIPPTEDTDSITQTDIDNLAQVFSLARKTVVTDDVNDENGLAQLINYKTALTAKLTKLIKTVK